MRKIIFILFLSIGLSSCADSLDSAFDIDMETFFVIPAGLNSIDTHVFEISNVPTFVRTNLPGSAIEDVTSVRANTAILTGRFTSIDFRIIERITIDVVSTVDNELDREAFFMTFIPIDQEGDLALFSSLPELREILLNETVNLRFTINFKSFVPSDIETRVLLNFKAFVDG